MEFGALLGRSSGCTEPRTRKKREFVRNCLKPFKDEYVSSVEAYKGKGTIMWQLRKFCGCKMIERMLFIGRYIEIIITVIYE